MSSSKLLKRAFSHLKAILHQRGRISIAREAQFDADNPLISKFC